MSQEDLDNFCYRKEIMCYRTIPELSILKAKNKTKKKRYKFKCTYENCTKGFDRLSRFIKHKQTHQIKCNYCSRLYNMKTYETHSKKCKTRHNNNKQSNYKIEDYFLKLNMISNLSKKSEN